MTTLIPEGPNTSTTTLLRDLIRIHAGGPGIVIDTSNEITGDGTYHLVSKPDEDE